MDWLIFLIQGPKLTNCSGPPSRGRKFQVTVRVSPTGAKLEKVHFNRISVPLTASSTRECKFPQLLLAKELQWKKGNAGLIGDVS